MNTTETRMKNHPEKYIKKEFNITCPRCGKIHVEILTQKQFDENRYKKYCCRSCANARIHSEETKKKTSRTLLNRYGGPENTGYSNRLYKHVCIVCGKEYESHSRKSTHCSRTCVYADPSVKDKLRQAQKRLVSEGLHVGWISRNISSYPEKFWESVLTNNNIKFERERFIKTPRAFLDFVIEKDGKVVDLEIDGSQHKYQKEHDEERDKELGKLGYIIYRIDWNEINTDSGKLLMKDKIDKFLSFYKSL